MKTIFAAALIAIACSAASPASARCLSVSGGVFSNSCNEKLIFNFLTIGGGCFMNGRGSANVGPLGSVQTAANQECNGRRPQRIEWNYCNYDAWVKGSCTLPR